MNLGEIIKNPAFQGLPEDERRKALSELVPGFGSLPLEEQNKGMAEMGMGPLPIRPPPIAPEIAPPAPGFDPTGQSMALGMGPADWAKPATLIGSQAEAIGAAGAPLMAGAAALPQFAPQLTNAAAYLRALPVAAPIAGMGAAAGGIIADAAGAQKGAGPTTAESMGAPMPDDPTAASLGMFQPQVGGDFATGAGAQGVGDLAALMFGRVLAPMGKGLSAGASAFREFAEKKGLPYGAELGDTVFSKITQGLSDYTGLGRYLNDARRREQIAGVSKVVQNIGEELGLPSAVEAIPANQNMQNWFRGIINKKLIYEDFNKAVEAIPADAQIRMTNVMDKFQEMGGLGKLFELEGTKKPSQFYYLMQRALKNDDVFPKDQFQFMNSRIWKSFTNADPELKQFMGQIKGAYLDDLGAITAPEMGTTLGTLRKAADESFKDGMSTLRQNPLAQGLVGRGNLEGNVNKLFDPYNTAQALALKDHLVNAGQGDTWNAVTSAWIRNGFDKASQKLNDVGERIFQPGVWLDWWAKNKGVVEKLTPEIMPALAQWEPIAMQVMKTMKKEAGSEFLKMLPTGMTSIAGGIGYSTSGEGGLWGVVVPNTFSLLASLATMGKGNRQFLRNYALKETAPLAIPALKAGAKAGYVNIAEDLPWAQ